MAIEVATAYVSIVPSAQNFTKKLQSQVNGQSIGDQLGKSIGEGMDKSFMNAIRNIRATLLTAIGIKEIAQSIGGAISGAFKVGADFERTQVAFTGLLGNAELANDELAKLQEFGKVTPFKFTGLAEDAKKLLAFGFSADQLIPTLTKLGDATAALGGTDQDINLVTRALGQMIGKGRVQLEEINQIAEALPGFNPIPALARSVNASEADFQKALSSPGGALTAFGLTGKQAVDTILNAMGEIPGAAGAMDRISHTLSGATANVADSLDILRINATKPLQPVITEFLLNRVIPAMQVAAEKVPKYSQKIADWLQKLVDKFDKNTGDPKFLADLKKFGKGLKVSADFVIGVLQYFAHHYEALINGILGNNAKAFKFNDPIADFRATEGAAIHDLLGFLGDVAEKVRPLLKAFLDEWDAIGGNTTIATGIKDIGDALQPLLDMVSNFAGDKTGDFLKNLGNPDNVQSVQKLADTLNGDIKTAFDTVIPKIKDFVKFVQDNPDAFAAAAAGFTTFAAATLTMATAVAAVSKAQSVVASVTTGLGSLATALAPLGVAGVVVAVILALAAAFVVAYIKIKPFHDLVDAVGNFIKDTAVGAFDLLKNTITAVVDAVRKNWSVFKTFLGILFPLPVIIQTLWTKFEKFREVVLSVKADLLSAGRVIVRFFVNVWADLPGILAAVMGFLKRTIDLLRRGVGFLAGVGKSLIKPFQEFIGWLRAHFFNTVGAILEFVVALAQKGIEILRPFFGFMIDLAKRLIQIGQVVGHFLKEGLTDAIRILVPIIKFLIVAFVQWFRIIKAQLAILLPIWEFVWKTVRDIVVSVFNTVKSIVTRGLDFIRGIFHIATGLIKGDWSKVWTGIKEVVVSVFGFLKDTISNSWNLIWKVISNIPFGRLLGSLVNLGKTIVSAAWTILKALVQLGIKEAPILAKAFWHFLTEGFRLAVKLIPIILGIITDFLGRLVQLAAAMLPVVLKQFYRLLLAVGVWALQMGGKLAGWVLDAIPLAIKFLGFLAGKILDWTVGMVPKVALWVLQLAGKLAGWVLDAIPWLLESLAIWGDALLNWIVGTGLPWLVEKIGQLAVALYNWVKDSLPGLLSSLNDWGNSIAKWIVETGIPWLVEKANGLQDAIIGWLVDAITALPGKLGEFGTAILNGLIGIPASILLHTDDVLSAIMSPFTDALAALPGVLQEMLDKVVKWVKDMPGEVAKLAGGAGLDLLKGAGSFLGGLVPGSLHVAIDGDLNVPDPSAPFVSPKYTNFASGGVFTKPFSGFANIAETAKAQPEILTPHRILTETFRAEIKRANGSGDGVGRHMTIENLNVLNPHKSNATEIADAVEAKLAFALTTRGDR